MFASIGEATGVTLKMEPQASVLARFMVARYGSTHFCETGADMGALARIGSCDFDTPGVGPQPIRAVWVGTLAAQGIACTEKSGIKTLADLKGKRVSRYPGTLTVNLAMEAWLAFANLTWDDVIPVDIGTYAEGYNVILSGAVDAIYAAPLAGKAYEMEASPGGLAWPAFPFSDTAGWERLQAINPSWVPAIGNAGAGMEGQNLETVGKTLQFMAWEEVVSDELAYWLAKQVHENYDSFKGKHAELVNWSIDNALLPVRWTLAYHPGSIKYFKDIKSFNGFLFRLSFAH